MSESFVQLLVSGLSVVVWAMTAYIFTGLKAELKDFRSLLNKVLLEHTVLQTNYAISVRDIDTILARLNTVEKDLILTRERNHDLANALQTLWSYAVKNGWNTLPSRPNYRNEN
jgi:hypothetical protein